jgi:hypothetical protein
VQSVGVATMRFPRDFLILGLTLWPAVGSAQDSAEIERIASMMVRLCVGGGSTDTVGGGASGGADLSLRSLDVKGNLKGEFKINKSKAEGLVEGINNAMNQVAADQADKVRTCLQPVRERLLDIMLPLRPNSSPTPSPKGSSSVVVAGVEVAINGMFLSTDKKTISANMSLKNTIGDNVLVMAVGTESAFVIPDVLNKSPVLAVGIANCTPRAGNAASTRLCLHDEDIRWTNLERNQVYTTHLTATLGQPITAIEADIRLHLLLKENGNAKPYDIPFNGVQIKQN